MLELNKPIDRLVMLFSHSQIFASDSACNLFCIDARNGRTVYGYKGIAGAVTSVAPTSDNHLASVSLDRFFRLHTAPSPPTTAGAAQSEKSKDVAKLFMKSTPTVVLWDGVLDTSEKQADEGNEVEDVWSNMRAVGDDSEGEQDNMPQGKKKRIIH